MWYNVIGGERSLVVYEMLPNVRCVAKDNPPKLVFPGNVSEFLFTILYLCLIAFMIELYQWSLSAVSVVRVWISDTVGLVFWPVKTVSHITYTVLAGT